LGDTSRNDGNAAIRELNLQNAVAISSRPNSPLLVRIMNPDAFTYCEYYLEGNPYVKRIITFDFHDDIWDFSSTTLSSTDWLTFKTRKNIAYPSNFTHGYQIYNDGVLTRESLGGSTRRYGSYGLYSRGTMLYGTISQPSALFIDDFHSNVNWLPYI